MYIRRDSPLQKPLRCFTAPGVLNPLKRRRILANHDSPLMRQYRETKERYPHLVVLFRVGDFFELFGPDAELGVQVLGLALTSRDQALPMAGFPHHALD